ncbi:hypothetical protein K469DRAFT_695492 [Zopfia rhizophila CBS 207.26]|uniref:Uncharacterized protein n=1 Tax=Zopfia rhizophila CBS 207.26 TaxID=1314779 RepID=A0A6A6DJK2_9PEZI|nr:hypothetical protein K469DRAFT_695492 [Zopfia rhizophila CBS 207.26]
MCVGEELSQRYRVSIFISSGPHVDLLRTGHGNGPLVLTRSLLLARNIFRKAHLLNWSYEIVAVQDLSNVGDWDVPALCSRNCVGLGGVYEPIIKRDDWEQGRRHLRLLGYTNVTFAGRSIDDENDWQYIWRRKKENYRDDQIVIGSGQYRTWESFVGRQQPATREEGRFPMYVKAVKDRLTKHGFTRTFQLDEDPARQDKLTTWIEYLGYEYWWYDQQLEAQSKLDAAEKDYHSVKRRHNLIYEFTERTKNIRIAKRNAERHSILLRWMLQQVPLIELELKQSNTTGNDSNGRGRRRRLKPSKGQGPTDQNSDGRENPTISDRRTRIASTSQGGARRKRNHDAVDKERLSKRLRHNGRNRGLSDRKTSDSVDTAATGNGSKTTAVMKAGGFSGPGPSLRSRKKSTLDALQPSTATKPLRRSTRIAEREQ